jgi:hypothetical protein
MINSFQDLQKVSKVEMNGYLQAVGEWNKKWQAVAAEMTDYSTRSFEDGLVTLQKLVTAKSVPEAIEIQTAFAKSAYEGYMQQISKVGAIYQNLAQDALKPFDYAKQASR